MKTFNITQAIVYGRTEKEKREQKGKVLFAIGVKNSHCSKEVFFSKFPGAIMREDLPETCSAKYLDNPDAHTLQPFFFTFD